MDRLSLVAGQPAAVYQSGAVYHGMGGDAGRICAMTFAKLYWDGDKQILVMLDEGDEGPEVRFFFKPPGLGVCSSALIFTDDDAGNAWEKAEAAFANVDEQQATALVNNIKNKLAGHFGKD